ncbi:hypothetical protein ACQ4PT_049642 [Festuca glaucescens]
MPDVAVLWLEMRSSRSLSLSPPRVPSPDLARRLIVYDRALHLPPCSSLYPHRRRLKPAPPPSPHHHPRRASHASTASPFLLVGTSILRYEKMDVKAHDIEVLTRRVEELQRERDELRKDIEQLCMQQSGPGYVSVATRMLSQRATALEQDIENLQKKLSGCLRENHNLQEELAEAYRVKSQLADLYGAELSKTKELEQQVRFFQSSVAKAFAERDNSLLECEKAKEREEAVLKMSAVFEERTKEYQSAMEDQKRLNDVLQMELTELKANTESSLNVILKFYEVRCRECECPSNVSFEEKCSILIDDSAENWSFSSDGETSTSKYIVNLKHFIHGR